MLTTKDKNNRIQLSLAAVMFFAPFVSNLLKNGNFELTQEDKKFIEGYLRLGFLIIGILLVTIAGALASYVFKMEVFVRIYRFAVGILIACLIGGAAGILANFKILQEEKDMFQYQQIKSDKSDIFLSFIPIYNLYLRYKLHDFEHSYRWAKESILRWTALTFVLIVTKSPVLAGLFGIMILIRVTSLMSGIDIIDEELKKKMNKLFLKNPEEIWGYPRAFCIFWIQKFAGKTEKSLTQHIQEQKNIMQGLLLEKDRKILAQYGVGLLLLAGWFIIGGIDWTNRPYLVGVGLVIGRYLLMFCKRKHVPNLPFAKEIVDFGIWIYQRFIVRKDKPKK